MTASNKGKRSGLRTDRRFRGAVAFVGGLAMARIGPDFVLGCAGRDGEGILERDGCGKGLGTMPAVFGGVPI